MNVREPITDSKTVCPACGSETGGVRVCPVCDKLVSEGFQPLDAIRSSYRMQRVRLKEDPPVITRLFEPQRPLVHETAWACNVYSMVPYLGVLFLPLAFAFGGLGYFDAQRKKHPKETRGAINSMILSMWLLAVQLFLWWLLFLIPELAI